ncbi:SRPBCC family protein [Celeribacter sp. ULVN23_4]
MPDMHKYHYNVVTVYPGFERQKYWDMFVDYEGWTQSDILAGEISILEPGEGHPMGKGAVRSVVSGSMTITEDITAYQSPSYFAYASRNGVMPVNDFVGELFLEQRAGDLVVTYKAGFNPRYFGSGWLFRIVFRRAHVSFFEALGKAYKSRYGVPPPRPVKPT